MRRFLVFTAAGIWLASALVVVAGDTGENSPSTCGNHGTSVAFVSTPSEAAQQAKKEQKLVFVLHVSGHFEDPSLT
jgi:hypothetical protein